MAWRLPCLLGYRAEVSPAHRIALVVSLALVYVGAALIGFRHAIVAEQVTLVWPPSGIALAALLLLGRWVWPGILLGACIANLATRMPIPAAAAIALGNTLEALAAVALLDRVGFKAELARLRDAIAFVVLAVLVSTMVSATIGSSTLVLSGMQPWAAFPALWRDWWLGDSVGDLTVAPVLLTWLGSRQHRAKTSRLRNRRGTELALLALALVAAGLLAFAGPAGSAINAYPVHYLVVPFVAWGALRFGPRGSAVAVLITACIAVASTTAGLGPFAGHANQPLLLLQFFVAVVALTGLLLGAAIGERNSHHAALRLTQARLRLALSAARIGSWRWDVRSNEVEWFGDLETMHGLEPGAFRGTFEAFLELVHPEDRERVKAAINKALEERAEYETEFRNQHADGVRWILGKGRVLTNAAGEPTAMIGVGMDVTERRRLTDELEARAHQLALHDRRKDEFLATLAHELRNPLAPIAAAVHLLDQARANPESIARLCRVLGRQTTHLSRLVDDLLDVSRITSGKVQLRIQRVDLNEIVSSAVDMSRPAFDERRLTLDVAAPSHPILLDADATRLAQVLANLLSNAARHGREGGHVWLSSEVAGENAKICVRDDGPGMSPELIERVFDLFVQGTDAGKQLGLGVGLTLARMLVELHGGRVQASSAGPGLGSEFVVLLPRSAAHVSAPVEANTESGSAATPAQRHVLVVDDNVDAADMLAALIEARGHQVFVAHDGPRALELARTQPLDVVLLDIEMPGMNGYEVARALRSAPELANVQLIAVSGHAAATDRNRSRLSDFDAHMVKPVDPQNLFAAIETKRATASQPHS